MKATGIVRRIDDLGRVVIPKEIRRTMRIREGDPLEIFTDKDGEVIFKKYSPIGELGPFAVQYAETLSKFCGAVSVICDRDNIIAVSGAPKRELFEKRVSSEIEDMMEQKNNYRYKSGDERRIPVVDGTEKYFASVVCPIVTLGDVIGAVMMLTGENQNAPDDAEVKVVQSAAAFLARHMET